jgi:hypothetical protein
VVEHHHERCHNCGQPFDHELLDFLSCELNECYRCTMIDEKDAYRRLRELRQRGQIDAIPMATTTIQ